MKKSGFFFLSLLLFSAVFSQNPKYALDSASFEHPGVPKGEIIKMNFNHSVIFPGTERDYWIYVPAQYRPEKPACVYVNQDGIQWKAPTVFDNLIFRKEMPVTIGIFISPGQVKSLDKDHALDRFNRSLEYDGLGSAYARFILNEILPAVEKQKTSDGRAIRLSKKYEPKPIRIFLQDGSGDLNIYGGDWWKSNEAMERALDFSGYEVNHVWGEGGHNGDQGTAVFPEAMCWLWKDWPKPVTGGNTKNQFLQDILIPGGDWELVGTGYRFTEGTAVNAAGEVFFQDIPNAKTYKVSTDQKLTVLPLNSKQAAGTLFGPDGKRYVAAGATRQVLSYDAGEKETVVADSINGNDLVVAANGNIYVTAPDGTERPSKLFLIRPNGEKLVVDEGLKFANGLALTPDQTQLYVAESASHWLWIYSIRPDGTLTNKQHFGWLHVPDTEENAWPDGLRCDRDGRVYVATRLGIQVLDQLGRVNAIIPVPGNQVYNLCFGGPGFDVLYIAAADKVYRRKVKVQGANGFQSPLKPAQPRL